MTKVIRKKLKNLIKIKVLTKGVVTPPYLTLANPMESLAIHLLEPTCDQMGNHPYKTVRVNA
jgi:hypothetical protein